MNLTDAESRIAKPANGSFEPCCNAQVAVDSESLLILMPRATEASSEWVRACLAWNLERMAVLRPKVVQMA